MWFLWERVKKWWRSPETHLFVQATPMPYLGPKDNPESLPPVEKLLFVAWMDNEVEDFVNWAGCKAEVDMIRGSKSVFLLLLSDQSTERLVGLEVKEFVDRVRLGCATDGKVGSYAIAGRCRWTLRKEAGLSEQKGS